MSLEMISSEKQPGQQLEKQPGIILFKNIMPVERLKFEKEFSQRLETCSPQILLRSDIPLDEQLVNIRGFTVRVCHRKETDKIWVIQEPNCKYYKSFLDHNKYRDNKDDGFGICDNMKDPRQREMYGCPLSKKQGIYTRVNYPEETYVFARMIRL